MKDDEEVGMPAAISHIMDWSSYFHEELEEPDDEIA